MKNSTAVKSFSGLNGAWKNQYSTGAIPVGHVFFARPTKIVPP
jgi:hypothetical protein